MNAGTSPIQLRAAIDRGQTGDKVAWPDPAAAPLGTDDEAGLNKVMQPSGVTSSSTFETDHASTGKFLAEGPTPNVGISRFNDDYGGWMILLGAGLLAATFVVLVVA